MRVFVSLLVLFTSLDSGLSRKVCTSDAIKFQGHMSSVMSAPTYSVVVSMLLMIGFQNALISESGYNGYALMPHFHMKPPHLRTTEQNEPTGGCSEWVELRYQEEMNK